MFFTLFAYLFTVLVYDGHINGKCTSKQTYNRQASNICHIFQVTGFVRFKLNLLIPVLAFALPSGEEKTIKALFFYLSFY